MAGNPAFSVAVKAVYDYLKPLKDGGGLDELAAKGASSELLKQVNRTDEFIEIQERYVRF